MNWRRLYISGTGWALDHFLCCGLEKVGVEMSLAALTYNLERAMNIVGPAQLIAAMQ